CIQNYIQITDEMLRFFSGGEDQAMAGPASRLAFWADVLYMNPKLLATEWKQANDGQFKSIGSGAIVTWGSFFTAWPSKQYQDDVRAAIRRHSSAALTDQAALCGEIEAAYSTWLDEVSRRFNHAAPHFDVVARSTMVWGKQEVQDARGYSLEA